MSEIGDTRGTVSDLLVSNIAGPARSPVGLVPLQLVRMDAEEAFLRQDFGLHKSACSAEVVAALSAVVEALMHLQALL